MDALDRQLINRLQKGFPVCAQPYAVIAEELGCLETTVIDRLQQMLESGVLSRFGPMYQAEKLGGALCLCAMQVPAERFDEVTDCVNSFSEVAHNYERDHELNMWFVLATDSDERLHRTTYAITAQTGIEVLLFPKEREFFVGLYLEV